MKEKEEGLHIESDKQESGQQFPERAAGEMQQLDSDIKAAELKDASEIKSAKESLEKTFPEEIKEPVIEKPERKLEPTKEENPGLLHLFGNLFARRERERVFVSPERRRVSDRDYDVYLKTFCLPETELESKAEPKIIVDIGAGLSNFSLETNKRFKDSGTVAVAVDPVYQSLGTDFKKFEENVGRANMETLSLDNPEDAYREIKDAPNKVAGSHQELPFGDESVDLVLANHAITQYDDKEITRQALQEARRVVKEHGEIRISPANIGLDKRENAPSYYYIGDVKYIDSKKSQNTEVVEEAEKLGLPLPPDRELFKIFKELEDTGLNFYVVKYGPKSNTRMARFARNSSPWTIILRKDDQLPNVEIGSDRGVFFKLAFGKSSDGFHVPWIGVSEEEE